MAWVSAVDRVPIAELKVRHRHQIEELRGDLESSLAAAGSPQWADDVWLLRYLLSFKEKIPEAAEAAKRAIAWRQENAFLCEAARSRSAPPGLSQRALEAIGAFYTGGYRGATVFGDPVFVIRAGTLNMPLLMDNVSEDELFQWIVFMNESVWQYCEALSLRKGYFVKQITLVDLAGVPMKRDARFFRAYGKSSKQNEWLRPQLIGKTVGFNPPPWIKLVWQIAATFMSKRSVDKVSIHKTRIGDQAPKGASGELCPFAASLLGGAGGLPGFVGGRAKEDDFPKAMRQEIPAGQQTADVLILAGLPRLDAAVDGEDPLDDGQHSASFFTPPDSPPESPLHSPRSGSPREMTGSAGSAALRGSGAERSISSNLQALHVSTVSPITARDSRNRSLAESPPKTCRRFKHCWREWCWGRPDDPQQEAFLDD